MKFDTRRYKERIGTIKFLRVSMTLYALVLGFLISFIESSRQQTLRRDSLAAVAGDEHVSATPTDQPPHHHPIHFGDEKLQSI